MEEIIGSCGSFLTVREETIYFVYQSAKDFLKKALGEILDEKINEASVQASKAVIKKLNSDFKKVFTKFFAPGWEDATHYTIFERSQEIMSSTLCRDMYNLKKRGCPLGHPAEKVNKPDPDPLAASRYACTYWFDHLNDLDPSTSSDRIVALQDEGPVHNFLREKYLYWLESLSLCRDMSKGVESMAKLETLVQVCSKPTPLHA